MLLPLVGVLQRTQKINTIVFLIVVRSKEACYDTVKTDQFYHIQYLKYVLRVGTVLFEDPASADEYGPPGEGVEASPARLRGHL